MKFHKFTEPDLHLFYSNTVKKEQSYLQKYDVLSNDDKIFLDNFLSHINYRWDVRDYGRVRAVLDFHEWVNKFEIKPERIAYTDQDDPELKLINFKNSSSIHYNGSNGDLHNIEYEDEFDFFLFNQTIEHLYNPFLCIYNIYKSLKPDGYVFTSVPTINIPHTTPIHYNGFNPMGLAMLFKSCGFNVLEIGQWGNYEYISKLFSNHQWPSYSSLSENGIKNEERNVAQCWILAKK
jgi:SAM-dependent methyltransferase|tara:strand:+ start:15033 stop:15737 length:705 start_codon:yes stop_codon:yes gene_type:complete